MADFSISSALARSRIVSGGVRAQDAYFAQGHGTRGATQPHSRQAAALAASRVVNETRRRRPTTDERQKEISRRRSWAGGGNMPPDVRALYSEAERAALAVIGEQCRRKGFCDLCIDEIANLAGVSRTSVQNAIRKARSPERGQISVRERPQQRGKSLTNIIKIICRSWRGWIGRAIGFKRMSPSETEVKKQLLEDVEPAKLAFETECVSAYRAASGKPQLVENHSKRWGMPLRRAHSFGGPSYG